MRQAKLSFNLLVGATSLSGIVGLAGAELFMSKKLSEGAVTTAIGLTSSMRFVKLAKDANDRLDEAIEDEDEE
ncbi:hypothetical protein [Moorena sp. SIO3H5]|uniref:TRADD-N-associated membrane domain-containing protein n=1 Tax=Moorena sp. SIO3H5 TaxID=2607834 RepID=UPI0013BE2774|nr:hypothetical protein [Moorena sp. SIO3H5]